MSRGRYDARTVPGSPSTGSSSDIQSQNHSSRSGICEKKNLLRVSSASPNILNGNSTGHKPPTTAASIPRRSNGGITRKPEEPRIMAPENPVIKSLSEQKKNPENPCCCGVFGISEIIPTRQDFSVNIFISLYKQSAHIFFCLYFFLSTPFQTFSVSKQYHA